jgi:hypothetical protein
MNLVCYFPKFFAVAATPTLTDEIPDLPDLMIEVLFTKAKNKAREDLPLARRYRSNIKAAPMMSVGKMAQINNFIAEIPSSPNRETRID